MARNFIGYKITDTDAQQALKRMIDKGKDMRVPLMEIGETVLLVSTKARFQTSTAPDGSKWAANSPVTISRYVLRHGGTRTKDKKLLSEKGETLWANKKPLIGRSKRLGHSIAWQMIGANNLEIGSPMIYAWVQQFGVGKGEFGKNVPWGDIPARAFLGLSSEDSAAIVRISIRFLAKL